MVLDIEVFTDEDVLQGRGQMRFLYHGTEDGYWCDTVAELLLVIERDLSGIAL